MKNISAFPRPFSVDETTSSFPSSQLYPAYSGMTLRDYFAAKAMQGLLASDVYAPIEKFATQAYAMADKMMEARNGSQ
jgi:hypothetical protein